MTGAGVGGSFPSIANHPGEPTVTDTLERRVQVLQDQVYALQQLVLCHVLAVDGGREAIVDATFDIAAGQIESMTSNGRGASAIRLKLMVESIQQCRN
jgi:hypothetical protein